MHTGLYAIPSGDAGTAATLRAMATLSRAGAVAVPVRMAAASAVRDVGRDPLLQARLLGEWVAEHTVFLADPSVAEALTPPEQLCTVIRREGVAQGDCDDVAMLAAALGLSIGLRARFVVIAFRELSAPFAHVYTELAGPRGDVWLQIDPTRPQDGGPLVTREAFYEV